MKQAVVITPTYGRLPLLGRLLASFLEQTYSNKTLVIINDDENVQLECNYSNVIIVNLNIRLFVGAKRNIAVSMFNDAIFLPVDDDDIILPDYIEKHIFNIGDNNLINFNDSYCIYGSEFTSIKTPPTAMAFTKKGWLQLGGYNNELLREEDQIFYNGINSKIQLEGNSGYIYNYGGVNYHLSHSDYEGIKKTAAEPQKKTFIIEPNYMQYNKFIQLDQLYMQKNSSILLKHNNLGEFDII